MQKEENKHWSNLKEDQSERKNEKHRRFIASLPCLMSDEEHLIQAAHIRSGTGGGTSYKPHDKWCVPLSCVEHAYQHEIGEPRYWGEKLELAKKLAEFFWKHSGNREICLEAIKAFKEI